MRDESTPGPMAATRLTSYGARVRDKVSGLFGASRDHSADVYRNATPEELRAFIQELDTKPAASQRGLLLAIGDQFLERLANPEQATLTYIKAAEREEVAKWEFGRRLLDAINGGLIAGRSMEAVAELLAARPPSMIVPDLWKAFAREFVQQPDQQDAAALLKLILPHGEPDCMHAVADFAREGGKRWASIMILDELAAMADRGEYAPGMGFYLKRGHALCDAGSIGAAIESYRRAQLADSDAKYHLGGYLLDNLEAKKLSDRHLIDLVQGLGDVDLIVPDLRPGLLAELMKRPRTFELDVAADALVREVSHGRLIDLADKALAKAQHGLAIYCYEEAIKKQPQDVLTRLQIGITHFLANEHQQAEAHFSTLMTLQAAERERWGVDKMPVRVMHWTWIQAFGHITCLDSYIKAVKLGWLPNYRTLLGFDRTNPPAGWRLLTYFSKYLEIVGCAGDTGPVLDEMIFGRDEQGLSSYHKDLRRASMMYTFWAVPNQEGRMRYFGNFGSDVQRAWKEEGRGALLEVEQEERDRFRMVMEQSMGLPRDAWFVLLHVRESSFKPGWEAHHQYTRNASIESYDAAIDLITSMGGWVIRAGDPSMRRLPPRKNVIDYATSPMRSPELDVLLCAECKFFLGTNSGFSLAPPLFGKRCVLTNWSPLANPNWYPDDIFVPKLVRDRKSGRYLTIEEMYKCKAGWSQFARDFQTDWEKLDNTPEEIVAAVKEMLVELETGVQRSPAALRREAAYHAVIEANGGYIGSRMSDGFLERNAWLVGEGLPRIDAPRLPAKATTPVSKPTATRDGHGRLADAPTPAAIPSTNKDAGKIVALEAEPGPHASSHPSVTGQ